MIAEGFDHARYPTLREVSRTYYHPGAQYLLHARTAMINGDLGRYTGVGDGERLAA